MPKIVSRSTMAEKKNKFYKEVFTVLVFKKKKKRVTYAELSLT